MTKRNFPGIICAAVLCCILVAGLAPFQKPRNGVTWLENENGLRFGKYGTIWSSGTFQKPSAQDETSCSLEMWLQPGRTNASSTVLAFYKPENPLQFSLHQYHALLILQREIADDPHRTQTIGIDVFRQGRPVFITITSGAQNTAMYVDGTLVRSFPEFRFGTDCAGKLVIGTSPVGNDSWSGQLKGLAIYRAELSPAEVLQRYGAWTIRGRPELSGNEEAMALYLFNERVGNIVHNSVDSGVDLYVPKRFSLLDQPFLKPFWTEFKLKPSYWKDILINVIGFIPFGFFFRAYWSSVREIKHPDLTTVVLGLAVSLTIEVLQSYLPTRDSGTTDLITNTLGTFLGVRLYGLKVARDLLAKIY